MDDIAVIEVRLVIAVRLPLLEWAVRRWLLATGSFRIVGQAKTASQAVALVEATEPSILLFDMDLPDVGGIEQIGTIRDRFPNLNILVLGYTEDEATMAHAVRMGAAGYIASSWGKWDLLRIVRAVARGNRLRLPDLSYQSVPTGTTNSLADSGR